MNKLDLIIDALEQYVNVVVSHNDPNNFSAQVKDAGEPARKALAAARELRALKPVARFNWNEAKFEWLTEYDYNKHHMTPLFALGE